MCRTVVTLPPSRNNMPPGPRGLPVVGSLLSVQRNPHIKFNDIARKYGDVCMIRLGSTPAIIISHPEIVREAFSKPEFSDKYAGPLMEEFTAGRSDIAFSRYDDSWRRLQRYANRSILSHSRVPQIVKLYLEPIMDMYLDILGEAADSGEIVNPYDILFPIGARAVTDIIFGVFGYAQDEGIAKGITAVQDTLDWALAKVSLPSIYNHFPIALLLVAPQARRARSQFKAMSQTVDFDSYKDHPLFDLDNPTCLLEVMLADERSGEIDMTDLKALVGDLIFGGIDTTTKTMTWFLLTLVNRPEVQDRIFEELESADVDGRRELGVEDMSKLPYTHAALMELMRLRPIFPFGIPHLAAKTEELAGYTIPEGAAVASNTYGIHRDERFWDAPLEYRPERFLPQADGSPSPNMLNPAYLPFGTGRRACPGQNLGLSMLWLQTVRLLHNFRFSPPDKVKWIPEEEVYMLTLAPKPYTVKLTRR